MKTQVDRFCRRLWIAVPVVGLVTVVSFVVSCTGAGSTSAFRKVDGVANMLSLNRLGTIRLDKKYGGKQVLEGQGPTRAIVVLSRQSAETVQAMLDSRLAGAGFTRANPSPVLCTVQTPCTYAMPKIATSVGVVVYLPGEEIRALNQEKPDLDLIVPGGLTGVLVTIGT